MDLKSAFEILVSDAIKEELRKKGYACLAPELNFPRAVKTELSGEIIKVRKMKRYLIACGHLNKISTPHWIVCDDCGRLLYQENYTCFIANQDYPNTGG